VCKHTSFTLPDCPVLGNNLRCSTSRWRLGCTMVPMKGNTWDTICQMWGNLKMIDKHNQEYDLGNHSFTVAMNAVGDMMSVASIAELWINEEFRWVIRDIIKQRQKQGKCSPNFPLLRSPQLWTGGRKAAFTAAGVLKGQVFRKTGRLVQMSEQNHVECFGSQGNKGFRGGLMDYALQCDLGSGGVDSDLFYPYYTKHQQQVLGAIERAKQVTTPELNSIICQQLQAHQLLW
ncbi:hypothetical protein MC885_004971, partial [Smutsia gigantea]